MLIESIKIYRASSMLILLFTTLILSGCVTSNGNEEVRKPWEFSIDEIRAQSQELYPGRSLNPGDWPGDARVGILLSFDVDNESLAVMDNGDLLTDSVYQFGMKGLERILGVLDQNDVPATFFIPAATLMLTPSIAEDIGSSGRHEFAAHGWIHEGADALTPDEQEFYLRKSVEEITRITGYEPVGYRPPLGIVTDHTIPLLMKLDFLYHSGFLANDVPYEILKDGEPTGLIELPPSLNLEDSLLDPLNTFTAGIQPPEDTLQSYKSAFDVAYREGGMVLLLMHPHVTGKLSRIQVLEGFIEYALTHEDVWFGTHRDAADHFSRTLGVE